MRSSSLYTLAISLVVGGIVLLLLLHNARRRWRSLRARRRAKRALLSEGSAERLLERRGYTILDRQPGQQCQVWVDGMGHDYLLRADFLVGDGQCTYIAEVKSGSAAPRITTRATRRQLLEYAVMYSVDGILLVNPERGLVQRVRFPSLLQGRKRAESARIWLGLGVGFLLGFALAVWRLRA